MAENLKDAWLMARPNEYTKFENNIEFERYVLSANGKWLEPTKEYSNYSIIIALEEMNEKEILILYLHELTHIKCFVDSLDGKKFDFTAPAPSNSFAD